VENFILANDYPQVNLNKAYARNIDCNKVRVPEFLSWFFFNEVVLKLFPSRQRRQVIASSYNADVIKTLRKSII